MDDVGYRAIDYRVVIATATIEVKLP